MAESYTNSPEPATAVEEVVVAEQNLPDDQNDEATNPSTEQVEKARKFRYPLTISNNYPARIIFRAIKVEGVDIAKKIGDNFETVRDDFRSLLKKGVTLLPGGGEVLSNLGFAEETTASVADSKVGKNEKKEISKSEKQGRAAFQSFENGQGGEEVGSVTLPLQRDLRFSDNAQYETANLGVLGAGLEQGLRGGNPFAGVTRNGQLLQASSAIAAAAVAKGVGEAAGAAVGALTAGGAGAVLGASALGGAFDGLSPAVRSATRIATAPNQRTLFQQVNIRSFAFTFKMVANNRQEAEEIKSIVKFFRQELYPEKIPLGETGVPLAYKFPNMFEIDVRNAQGNNPAFKIQRCYLRDIQTAFNSTATGMHDDGSFIEVDISLAFQEIVALDKQKIRDGY